MSLKQLALIAAKTEEKTAEDPENVWVSIQDSNTGREYEVNLSMYEDEQTLLVYAIKSDQTICSTPVIREDLQ